MWVVVKFSCVNFEFIVVLNGMLGDSVIFVFESRYFVGLDGRVSVWKFIYDR